MKPDYRCAAIEHVNECEYALIGNGYFGCKYTEYCAGKRPQFYNVDTYNLLLEYNEWLYDHGYTDSDIYAELDINDFLKEYKQ